jgi:hypothetical protein
MIARVGIFAESDVTQLQRLLSFPIMRCKRRAYRRRAAYRVPRHWSVKTDRTVGARTAGISLHEIGAGSAAVGPVPRSLRARPRAFAYAWRTFPGTMTRGGRRLCSSPQGRAPPRRPLGRPAGCWPQRPDGDLGQESAPALSVSRARGRLRCGSWRGGSGSLCGPILDSKDVAASWAVRLEAEDGRQASTIVDYLRTAMDTLEFGSVADDTRMALRTQGRTAVENVVRRGDEPPARIICSTQGCHAES